tara:strand:- start:143 stop:448 length:306 start_codon:yes stop_codon:yes gene_type:complete
MPRNTPLKFVGQIAAKRMAEKLAQRRQEAMGDDAPPISGLSGIINRVSRPKGLFGGVSLASRLFSRKPKAEDAGVPPHSHDVEDTDVESPMAKKLKFGRKK